MQIKISKIEGLNGIFLSLATVLVLFLFVILIFVLKLKSKKRKDNLNIINENKFKKEDVLKLASKPTSPTTKNSVEQQEQNTNIDNVSSSTTDLDIKINLELITE